MPEVRILSWTNEEICSDALPMIGFEHYTANDYKLVFFQNQQKRKQTEKTSRRPSIDSIDRAVGRSS